MRRSTAARPSSRRRRGARRRRGDRAPRRALKRGGTITVLSAGDVDHIDPGQAYYSFTYEITYATQRPLLAYRPDSVNAVPDLAAAMPKVSNGGKTVTVHIRHGRAASARPSTAR